MVDLFQPASLGRDSDELPTDGLEPSTSWSTARRSNQLSYVGNKFVSLDRPNRFLIVPLGRRFASSSSRHARARRDLV